ncbi:sugar (and other) transporter family protein [Paraburkholderia xenovorans LB400]|jgi:MFS transporter, MHS family, citrate/tricarballylate:H+ symporter|uniref:Major facilitator superfamily (MFS) metabolite(Citrate)/H+ symporter n=1 Tax=Paraburkholderia xenovorans (strain LB400) TaxID=266265 RepID=Q13PD5_PARXL|nr:MFS transporter [Paraburkholderia xenovorans]ABE34054.1 Major facilitator superfamily (MFS) metabolite(citrate)/H+ symporter [Paraburkholderia xenovorans LB400]AIP37960.1 sugar (and other) transporter family protein [Paraburkholderia xenovorans LB400]
MATPDKQESPVRTILRVTSGNFLEMYDFSVYGFYAVSISHALFPRGNEFVSLMLSLATFGVGFLMRPIGALVLGSYIDRKGRRAGLLLTLALMAAGMLMITFTPGYQTIGMAAPVIVVLGRLLQGFSAGAELGGVSVYLAEIAPPGKRGFWVSWQSASQQAAVVFAAVLGVALRWQLTPQQMDSWGWRIPFVIGCLIIPVLFTIRRRLRETEAFEKRTRHPSTREIFTSLSVNARRITGAIMMVTLTAVMFNLITAYTPTFGSRVLHLPELDSFAVAMAVGVVNFAMLPIVGALSDRIGRRPVLLVCAALVILTAYPLMLWLVQAPSFARLLAVEVWYAMIYGSWQAGMVVALTELMPAHIRGTGFSLVWSLAQAIFGGFTPVICTVLIHMTGNRAMPALWVSLAAVVALIATLRMYRDRPSAGDRSDDLRDPALRHQPS